MNPHLIFIMKNNLKKKKNSRIPRTVPDGREILSLLTSQSVAPGACTESWLHDALPVGPRLGHRVAEVTAGPRAQACSGEETRGTRKAVHAGGCCLRR